MEALPGDRPVHQKAVGGQQPSSRTATSTFVEGGTGRALPEQNDLQQATNVHVSAQMVRNRLHEGGMRARRPQVEVVFTAQHRAGRLAFAREHRDGNFATGNESRITLSTCDRRDRVW
uniref:Transposase Tc1-like domain-containing protein n=1 Tax=Astatotilapia calliptera TaxID=8154 RepID=A0AAX7SS17_ASTCA